MAGAEPLDPVCSPPLIFFALLGPGCCCSLACRSLVVKVQFDHKCPLFILVWCMHKILGVMPCSECLPNFVNFVLFLKRCHCSLNGLLQVALGTTIAEI